MVTLQLDEGYVFRIAFPPTIRKGQWYLGVICKQCKRLLLYFTLPNKNQPTPLLEGLGKLSIACYHCDTDELYSGSDIKKYKADFNRRSFRDDRVKPTGSSRQPLGIKHKGAKPTFGIGALEQRPEAAQIIARCIAYWTVVETQVARLLATILKANTKPAIALYLSLNNARAKNDAMNAAAETTLDSNDLLLFRALMSYKTAVEKERTALAHGLFGIVNKIKTGVVWVDTTSYAQYSANHRLNGFVESEYKRHIEKCFVYELGDLETIALEIENLDIQLGAFNGYLGSDNTAFRTQRYPQLCSEPRVRKELDRLGQKTAPANNP